MCFLKKCSSFLFGQYRIHDKTSTLNFRAQCKLEVYPYCKLKVAIAVFFA